MLKFAVIRDRRTGEIGVMLEEMEDNRPDLGGDDENQEVLAVNGLQPDENGSPSVMELLIALDALYEHGYSIIDCFRAVLGLGFEMGMKAAKQDMRRAMGVTTTSVT